METIADCSFANLKVGLNEAIAGLTNIVVYRVSGTEVYTSAHMEEFTKALNQLLIVRNNLFPN